jgi:hypothetical protein
MKDLMRYAASMKNPPKGYGSITAGLAVASYRSERMKYWKEKVGNGSYTDEVFDIVEDEIVAKFGHPF